MLSILKKPRILILLIVATLIGGSLLYALIATGLTPSDLKEFIDRTITTISDYPVLVYLSVLIVGGLPLPLSPFLILAGVLFTERYGLPVALLLCYSAMVLNMIWTYFLSAYPMRTIFEKMMGIFAKKFPEIPDEHKSKVTLIIRITPGIPFFLQNYFLGVSRVPFGKYLLISMAIQAMYTSGFVIGGGAIFEGKAGLAIAAVSIFVILGFVVHWLRSRNPETIKTADE